MLQSSKLSNRFKSSETDDIVKDRPKKFVFSKAQINSQNVDNELNHENSVVEEQVPEKTLDIDFETELKKSLFNTIF